MTPIRSFIALVVLGLSFQMVSTPVSTAAEYGSSAKGTLVYFGTYTGAASKGIYMARFDSATGKLSAPELAAEIASPSFLAVHPNRKFLYAVSEVANYGGKKSGAVAAFAIDRATGKLTLLNQKPSIGDGPCHLVVDRAGKHVLVANYGGGSTTVLRIENDGRLGESTAFIQHKGSSVNKERQQEPHAHSASFDKANRFAFVSDLGLDKVLVYQFDAKTGTLVANDPPAGVVKPGAGPRHFTFDPTGRHGYVIDEIDCTVTAFTYDSKRGALDAFQTVSTLPPGQSVQRGFSTAEIQVHPSGRFVYGSNRGHDTIVVFARDPKTGRLSHLQNESTQGKTPRHFTLDPSGKWLLAENQDSDTVVVFAVDSRTGRLSPTGQSVGVGKPVCIQFVAK